MTPEPEPSAPARMPPAPGGDASSPFDRPGLLARVAPFAIVAMLAEASLALPPGIRSPPAAAASLVLLLATAAAFLLPWSRLPAWMPVMVPLLYTGSVLALILATGPTSGAGTAVLIPLVWTALFHRRWESACVVAAIVVTMVITSLTPVAVPGSVIARRVLLWASLGALISVAAHGLRDRIRRSQEERERLQARLRELSVMEDRDRIAAEIKDKVIQRIFAAGLSLQGVATLTDEPEVRSRVGATVEELDRVVRILRDSVYGFERRLHDRGLRREVLHLCAGLPSAPELSFAGPVDGALQPGARIQLLDVLRETLDLLGRHSAAARIAITASDDSCVTVVETEPPPGTGAGEAGPDFSGIRDRAAHSGIRLDIEPLPSGTRLALKIPFADTPGHGIPSQPGPHQDRAGLLAGPGVRRS